MKPLATTMLMAILALVTSIAAWYYYPRIETAEEGVRDKLLTEENAFERRDVRMVRVERFDRNTNSPSIFEFELESGSWVIRDHDSYPANNTERVAAAVDALRDKEVLEVVSDNKNDHEEYGVLELSELGSTGLGAGTVMTFEGRNQKRLGKLIVGTSPEGKPDQRYVRLAGQPQIYVVQFDSSVLTTEFSDWVDGKLIKVGSDEIRLPDLIKHLDVDLYYRDQGSDKKSNYRARIRLTEDKGWVYDLWRPGEDKQLPEEPTLTDQPVNRSTLGNFVQQVMNFSIQDVARKQQTSALDLSDPKESQPASHFDDLKNRGFFHTGFENGQHQFDAGAGEITIAFRFGMEVKIYAGTMLGMGVSGGGDINRSLMLTSNVNPELLPVPEKPDGRTGETSSESEDGKKSDESSEQESEATDDAERKYQAELKQRQELLDFADRQSRSFNQVHADWIYEVPEDTISRLFPPADAWKNPSSQ